MESDGVTSEKLLKHSHSTLSLYFFFYLLILLAFRSVVNYVSLGFLLWNMFVWFKLRLPYMCMMFRGKV